MSACSLDPLHDGPCDGGLSVVSQTIYTLPVTATHGTVITINGMSWTAVWEGTHFFWERSTQEAAGD